MKKTIIIASIIILSSCKKENQSIQPSNEKSFIMIEAVQEDGAVITSNVSTVK